MAISKFQKFDTEVIKRIQIKNAPYNPRIMDKEAKKKLKEEIKSHGLVSALTWNKRTGNLVGGHQRLEQLDALEKNDDYEIAVCVVDVDEKEEAILNVLLNNPSLQGDWDLDKLASMGEKFDLDFQKDLKFSELDVDLLFDGDDRFSELFEQPDVKEVKGSIEKVKEARQQGVEKLKEKNGINWYTVIVFNNEDERNSFMREISIPTYEMYITEDQVRRLTGEK